MQVHSRQAIARRPLIRELPRRADYSSNTNHLDEVRERKRAKVTDEYLAGVLWHAYEYEGWGFG